MAVVRLRPPEVDFFLLLLLGFSVGLLLVVAFLVISGLDGIGALDLEGEGVDFFKSAIYEEDFAVEEEGRCLVGELYSGTVAITSELSTLTVVRDC